MSSSITVDAQQFFARGQSLFPGVVRFELSERGSRRLMTAVHITRDLVLTFGFPDDSYEILVDGVPVEASWSTRSIALARVSTPCDALADISFDVVDGQVTILWHSNEQLFVRFVPAAEAMPGSSGAPVFDASWSLVGLHDGAALRPISQLLRELEPSPYWDEVAKAHRLVKSTVSLELADEPAPELARAVRWDQRMPVRERRRALQAATLDALRDARGDAPATSAEQRALDAIIFGRPMDLQSAPLEEVLAYATAVGWFDGVANLPETATLERAIHERRRREAIKSIIGPSFAPRDAEVAHLEAWLARVDRPPLVVRGPGGIGKSALLAFFVKKVCPPARFAWLDFDRPDVTPDEATVQRVVKEHLAWQPRGGTLIVVLDSFETSVAYGYTRLNPALDALAREYPDLAVVVGSRSAVPLLKVEGQQAEQYDLPGLDEGVATQWLIDRGVASGSVKRAAEIANGIPLNLRLAGDLLAGKSEAEAKALLDELPARLVEGYLYRRILHRLGDEALREIAAWLMVPRRLVEPLVGRLLTVLGSSEDAAKTFAALSAEATLLEGDGSALLLRPDLRNTLLHLLREENADRLVALDAACATFWTERAATDLAAAGEAVYHHLRAADLANAESCWRDGVESYLRGYTLEEVPETSQVWLQRRLAGKGTEDRVEDMLARGRLGDARAALADQPRQTQAASRSARRRRLLGFLAPSPDFDENLSGLESIVLTKARPAFRVANGTFAAVTSPWELLEDTRDCIERAIAATGQLRMVGDRRVLGTAVLVGPKLFATTRAAAASFVVGTGVDVRKIVDRHVEIDLRAEGAGTGEPYRVERAVLVHPHWDLALLEIADDVSRKPLALATTPLASGTPIVAIGHPGDVAPDLAHLRTSVYADVVDVKRVMPGRFSGVNQALTFGHGVAAGTDDASTLSADPGAAVIDPETGALVGVRFATEYLSGNHFVPAWELVRDPAVVAAGVRIVGTPDAEPTWTLAGRTAATNLPRQLLLDAYVAWRENDTSRTLAILALVPDSSDVETRTNRALLDIACGIRGLDVDRRRSGTLIEQLVDGGGLSPADVDDLVATRLRLVVDADAELALLEHSSMVPYARSDFRVLVGPPDTRTWPTRPGLLVDTLEVSQRVIDADGECRRLAPWALAHGQRLLQLDIGDVSRSHARTCVASLVAFPKEIARAPSSFLLSKLDLDPHPTLGWTPVLAPLRVYMSDPPKDLATWLASSATSGRLGAYLDEHIKLDTDVAWAAGLYHLLTPLPIEEMLARRFTQS